MTKLTPDTASLVLRCECKHVDHIVEFTLEDWAGPGAGLDPLKLVIRPMLNPSKSFFYRLFVAFGYLFRIPGKYCSLHFDSIIISDDESIDELDRLLKRFIGIKKLRETSRRAYVRGTD